MTAFENRERFQTFEEAKKIVDNAEGWISHILINEDGTYSVMSHINCEWCVYCETKRVVHQLGIYSYNTKTFDEDHPLVHKALPDPYNFEDTRNFFENLKIFDPYRDPNKPIAEVDFLKKLEKLINESRWTLHSTKEGIGTEKLDPEVKVTLMTFPNSSVYMSITNFEKFCKLVEIVKEKKEDS